ncbi:hypothetical protein NP493_1139g00004 [Ridgeia piscesae]|uniref:Uncharacterized protein n=1 Tax=Ridgeia piscesae TaxID=27915 RepID=A0AAD9KHT6_RIDPI|nr:hypothetical protein NP493_1139g00004 [Ridgeia piscesae]
MFPSVTQAALGLFGMIGGPTLGLFMMAMTNPWSNRVGAYCGYIVGLIATIWLGIGAFIYKPSVSRPSVSRAGCLSSNDTMYSSGNDPDTIDPRLLTPVVESFLCCLPRKFRKCIQCNIDRTVDDDELVPKPDEKTGNSHENDGFNRDTKM